MKKKLLAASLLATSLAACGGDDHHDHADPIDAHDALAADACAHVTETMEHVTAAADPAAATNAVSETHQPFHVMLPLVDDAHAGAVLFTPDEAGEYAFFTDGAATLAILDGDAEVAIEATETVDACAELTTMHLADLELGTQYTLVFGPGAADAVVLVTLHAGDDGHGHE
ncbi:hypothetical protein [Vulgatibacter sp.]|uniref:hypothetical protein n=1 Tax=Vulgatibacter sp. TaxID=1971226 RepID=UPI003562EA04